MRETDHREQPARNLTKRVVDALQPDLSGRKLWIRATDPRGLFVLVHPSGTKSFVIRYTVHGRRRNLTLGMHGIMSVDEAKRKARILLGRTENQEDPAAEKAAEAKPLTFKEWAAEYMDFVSLHKKSARYDALYLGTAEKHWGAMLLNEITSDDVQRLFELVRREGVASPTSAAGGSKGRTLQKKAKKRWSKTGPKTTTANRWLASVRACLREAWRRKKIKELPAMTVRLLPENEPRTRVLSDPELSFLLQAVAEHPDESLRAAFTVLIETGCRLSEVLRAEWKDFDLDNRLWRLPSPKAGKPQIQPLADSTVAMLRNLNRVGPFIIPGRIFKETKGETGKEKLNRHRSDLTGPWRLILSQAKAKHLKAWEEANPEGPKPPAGFLEGVTIHDIRRTFGLHVARKAGVHVASKLLRHSSVEVTARVYAPLGVDELRQAMEDIQEDRGKVLPMRRSEQQ